MTQSLIVAMAGTCDEVLALTGPARPVSHNREVLLTAAIDHAIDTKAANPHWVIGILTFALADGTDHGLSVALHALRSGKSWGIATHDTPVAV